MIAVAIPKIFHTKLLLHPEKPEYGTREYIIEPYGNAKEASFWITEKDIETIETGTVIRLMETFQCES
jgi:hypothetical protein